MNRFTRRGLWWLLVLPAVALGQSREARQLLDRGRELFREHDDTGDALREAETAFRQALVLEPKFASAQAYLGLIALEQQRPDAERFFTQALSWDPRCAEALVGLAHMDQSRGRRQQALELLRRAVSGAPRNAMARRELGYALTNEIANPNAAMRQEAVDQWRALIGLDRNDRDAHYELAHTYRQLGRWREAEPEFREVLRIGQTADDSDVWVYSVHGELAEALARQGKTAEAIREYEALIASGVAGDEEIRQAREAIANLQRALRSK